MLRNNPHIVKHPAAFLPPPVFFPFLNIYPYFCVMKQDKESSHA